MVCLVTGLILAAGVFGLCWGSFLNMLAYRLAFDKNVFTARSRCPSCDGVIAWYDNIPVLSWLMLCGRCRQCAGGISVIYPVFELVTAVVVVMLVIYFLPLFSWNYYLMTIDPYSEEILNFFTGIPTKVLWQVSGSLLAYFLFFSALISATISDLRAMVIPQLFSLWLVPVGIGLALFGVTGVPWKMSLLGAVIGYGVLWLTGVVFKALTKKDGLGVGDMELLSMIGAFLGPVGVWVALMFGSVAGLCLGSVYLFFTHQGRATRIPFGPFLALGALLYFFFQKTVVTFFM